MINSRNEIITSSIIVLILFIMIPGCGEISHGLQRKKFEFLYKLNNYSSLLREFTGGISFPEDLDNYDNRLDKLYEDIIKIEAINGYNASDQLKNKFLSVINENIRTSDEIKNKHIPLKTNIRNDFDVRMMNERVDELITEINDEISRVGKE